MTPQAISWPLLSLAAALAAVMLLLFLRCRRQAAARRLDLEARLHDLQRQYASSLADTRALLNQLPEVILIFERQWPKLLFANRQALELFQCEDEHALMERVFSRPDHWLPTPHSLLDFEQWLATGRDLGVARKEWCFAVGSGASVWLDCAVSNTVFAAHPARLFSGANIHHRKMESLADRLRERALVGINEGKPVERLLDTAIKLIEVQQPGVRCVISLYDQPKDLLVTHGNSGFARDFRRWIPSVPARYGATSIGTAAHTRNRVICEALHQDHRWQGHRQVYEELGVDAAWSEPVLDHAGNLLAVITLFSETSRQPDGELLRQFSSVVSLVGLGIEHQHWKSALEASSANERFIRDIGMEIVNIPADDYVGGLTAVGRRLQAHYGLGALSIWEVRPASQSLEPVAGTVVMGDEETEPKLSALPVSRFEAIFGTPTPEYLTVNDELYDELCLSDQGKPVLVIPLYSDEQQGPLLGFVSVEARYQFVPTATIEYLRVVGSVLKTSLINRRLMASLSASVETERQARETLENELSVARNIQMSMVPGAGAFLQQYRAWTIEAWLSPAKAVGGDFYEVIQLPDGRLLVAVGDVSDKGAPAALFMARTVSLLNFLARSHDGDLVRIAGALNDELCRANDACMFVTMMLGVLDLGSGLTRWINAGHNPPLYVDTLSAPGLWSESAGPPFGLYEGTSYGTETLRLQPGQSLILYTDGLTEAFDPNGQAFGEDRLVNMGYRAANQAEGLLDYLKTQLLEFTRDAPQSDDVTLLTIQHHGTRP